MSGTAKPEQKAFLGLSMWEHTPATLNIDMNNLP